MKFTRLFLSLALVLTLVLGSATGLATGAANLADGIYYGAGAGMYSNIEVSVTVKDGAIADVQVLSHDETPGLSDPAIEQIPAAIVAAGTADVDVVSNATMTSKGIIAAVKAALDGSNEETEAVTIIPDFIVVGSGMAGLSAAAYALDLGLSVLVIEESVRTGGCIHTAGGTISGAGFEIQKENGIEDTPEAFYADIVALGGEGEFNEELAQMHTQRAKDAIDWLDTGMQVDFGDRGLVAGSYTAMPTPRVTRALGSSSMGAAKGFLDPLNARLEQGITEGKAQILFNTRVTEVLVNGDECYGVKVGDVEYLAPSVVLATGGFAYNQDLLKMAGFENVISAAPKTSNGSGHLMALAVGGVLDNMDEFVNFYGGGVLTGGFDMVYRVNGRYPGFIYVNNLGDRVGIEEAGAVTMWKDAHESKLYAVLSANMIDEAAAVIGRPLGNKTPLDNNGWGDIETLAAEGIAVLKADTLEELADMMGAENLITTIDSYNTDVAAGTDAAFGRNPEMMVPFENGPYYAIVTVPYVWSGVSGGVRANEEGYLWREDGSVVQGLSFAGEILGPSNILGKINFGGINHSMCATWGMIAAEHAAQRAAK